MTFQALSFIKNFKEFVKILTSNTMGVLNNQKIYESDDVVAYFTEQDALQKPEATILNEFKTRLSQMRMLDIGVGAGRTTTYFAPLSKEYLGIDYSSKMIQACKAKFKKYHSRVSFLKADARTMKTFKDQSFDFILFSFNGIDYMNHEERISTLREIRRLLSSEGFLCFSTHNLNFLLGVCSLQLSRHPIILTTNVFRLIRMRLLNKRDAWKAIRNPSRKANHTMVNDGAMKFRLKTYYITPD